MRKGAGKMLGYGHVSPNILGFPEFSCGLGRAFGVLRCPGVVWWAHQDSNLGPSDYESDALTN
jgi:hypothetical protein